MNGFEKIELSTVKESIINKDNIQESAEESKLPIGRISKNKLLTIFAALLILLFFLAFAVLIPARKTYVAGMKTYAQARVAWNAVKQQDIEGASKELEKTKKDLLETQKNLHTFSFVRFIPLAGGYYNDADHMINAGLHGLDAGGVLIDAIEPYTDILGLEKDKGNSFVSGSAEQRIQTAVLTLGKITPRIDDIAGSLVSAQKEIDQVNPNRYPSFIAKGEVKKNIQTIQTLADQGVVFVQEAKPLVKLLPDLAGESKEKKYLIIFQNDNEIRPTGGFMTAYAIFRVDKGIIHVDQNSDIYNLDNSIRNKPKAPDPLVKYLKVSSFHLRDTNISPDFAESMKTFNSLYQQAPSKVDVDGIVALDTHVLVSTIKILDDEVYAGGVRFTSQTDPRCDCPQVIYELERLITTPKSIDIRYTDLSAVQAQRKDMLGVLLYAIMEKALKSSPKKYWGPLMQDMINEANQKHILVNLYNKDAQAGIEALNVGGRIKAFDGDYLHISQANLGGAKSNLFVDESVTQNIEISGDGVITKTITINYKNPHPPSDCNLERGNLCLNGILRNWIRVYVPVGSELVTSKGSEVKVTTYKELGKTVFDGFLTVRPKGTASYTLTYKLPFKLKKGSKLPLLIQKQPGTHNFEYRVMLNNQEVEKFNLLTDKELTLHP